MTLIESAQSCSVKLLIVGLAGHHRYQLTPLGRRVAVLFTGLRASPS